LEEAALRGQDLLSEAKSFTGSVEPDQGE
jgi:hypothetical protein